MQVGVRGCRGVRLLGAGLSGHGVVEVEGCWVVGLVGCMMGASAPQQNLALKDGHYTTAKCPLLPSTITCAIRMSNEPRLASHPRLKIISIHRAAARIRSSHEMIKSTKQSKRSWALVMSTGKEISSQLVLPDSTSLRQCHFARHDLICGFSAARDLRMCRASCDLNISFPSICFKSIDTADRQQCKIKPPWCWWRLRHSH